jgi:Ca-activated chloride channel family protein
MFSRLHYVAIAVLVVSVCDAGEQPAAFRSEVNLVNIAAIVRSNDGKLLRDLGKEDFEVIEDGVPQKIVFFARAAQLPLSLGIIVDVSGSQDKFLKQHNRDVALFLNAVLRPADQAFAVCFGNHLRLVSEATSSPVSIMQGLERFQKGDRHFPEIGPRQDRELGTAFYDALYFSITEPLKTAGERRRALVILGDGEDNSSEHDLLDVIEAAQNTDTVVYCIRYTESKHGKLNARNKYGARVMRHISGLSGGTDFDGLTAPLGTVFEQISEELRTMYQLGYVPSNIHANDGAFRKVTVRCRQAGSSVRAKSGYYARTSEFSSPE